MPPSPAPDPREQPPVLRVALGQDRGAPAAARAALGGFSEGRDVGPSTLATLQLLVSELVTNAVVHPDPSPPNNIRLYARIAQGLIRVEVTNSGSGFIPEPRDPARIAGGYGLFLLEKASTRWGFEVRHDTTVWFELTNSAS
jgi:anti-sigma regulatory factor (Ser/Thr protein kinase)